MEVTSSSRAAAWLQSQAAQLGTRGAFVHLLEGDELRLTSHIRLGPAAAARLERLRLTDPGLVTLAARKLRPCCGSARDTGPDLVALAEAGADLALAVPLFRDGAVAGVATCGLRRVDRESLLLEVVAEFSAGAAELLGDPSPATALLQPLLERCPLGVLLLEPAGPGRSGHRVRVNAAFEGLVGRAGLKEEDLTDLFESEGGQKLPEDELPTWRALRGMPTEGQELFVRRPDGGRLVLRTHAAPLTGADGQPCGAVVLFDDVTDARNQQRNREEWTSIIAHDLRQPLNGLNIQALLLETRARAGRLDGVDVAAAHILACARQLDRLIDDLMDHALLASGRLRLRVQDVELKRFLEGVVARAAPLVLPRPLRLNVEGGIRAHLDPGRIEQVLTNLISNAQKYGFPETPITVAASVTGAEVRLSVINEGAGIPRAELSAVFDRFHRTAQALRAGLPGQGLGLHVASGIVEAHGGFMWAESTPGATTAFHFTLPVAGEIPRPPYEPAEASPA